jgi:hypothetical protein
MSSLIELLMRKNLPRHGRGVMDWLDIIPAVAVLCAYSSLAHAEVLLFSTASKAGMEQYETTDTSWGNAFVKLNNTGATKLSFTTTAPNQRVIITFTAVCLTGGGASANWLRVAVLVDPAGSVGEFAAPPTDDSALTFCFGGPNKSTEENAMVMASARPALAGTHTVRVRVSYSSMTGSEPGVIYLWDATLAVTR